VETIDSTTLHLSDEFAEDKLGIRSNGDGSFTITMVAARYGFYPQRIEVPADTPITLRIASADVLHGVHIPYTNMNTMVVPGYVSQVTTRFANLGEVPLFCNEFCGLGHDHMWSRLIVIPKSDFKL
jgi:cytochrome c oxidase subunit 2